MNNISFRSGNSLIDFVFDACVNLLLFIGWLTGLSYNAVNVIIFCVIWPIFTLCLIARVFWPFKSKTKQEQPCTAK